MKEQQKKEGLKRNVAKCGEDKTTVKMNEGRTGRRRGKK